MKNYEETTILRDKYYATIQISDYYGSPNRQIQFEIERGKKPTIGTYVDLFREHFGVQVEIKDLSVLEFKVINPAPKGIRFLQVIRLLPEYMYAHAVNSK